MTNANRATFGYTPAGERVELLTLTDGTLTCEILTLGAALRSLTMPDRLGRPVDVVLGYDRLEDYLQRDKYFGAVVGRCANRIAGGRFSLGGQTYQLTVNNGPNHLHGGAVGFSQRLWQVEELEEGRAVLSLFSPDGEEGYPGDLRVRVEYRLEGGALELRYTARGDRDTLCSLTNHSYFNLSGHGSGPALDQEVCIHAGSYTPANAVSIPLGTLAPVEGTPMDLRRPTPIGAHIGEPFDQLLQAGGYDHNYAIDGEPGRLRPAAWARSAATGITLEVETTLPGLQFYTANYVEEGHPGKEGRTYGPRHGFCLETQFFPDSPNQPAFRPCLLRAGEGYDQRTRFVFSTGGRRIGPVTEDGEKAELARQILEALPEWFGIPEAREEYIRESAGRLFFAAWEGPEPIGFLYLKETGTATLELAAMGVRKEYHRQGVGRALFEAARGAAREKGYAFLQVKTVQMGRYEKYDRTNRFYLALGFQEFEVFPTLWGPQNPCQVYVMAL